MADRLCISSATIPLIVLAFSSTTPLSADAALAAYYLQSLCQPVLVGQFVRGR